MPEVMINGPEGRLEARYKHGEGVNPPIALLLHPHSQHGGTMNNRVVYTLFHTFQKRGFSCLRFNFRGVGRSQGVFNKGEGELSDAASALDWLQTYNENARQCWIAGFSFGAWIGMQLLMRRPEISGFLAVSTPANLYDFSFLAPCPASGLMLHGGLDEIVPVDAVDKLAQKLNSQKSIDINRRTIDDATHFFSDQLTDVETEAGGYLDHAMDKVPTAPVDPRVKAASTAGTAK